MKCHRKLQLNRDIVIISEDFLSLVPFSIYTALSVRINRVNLERDIRFAISRCGRWPH